jgi:hypothetical protein
VGRVTGNKTINYCVWFFFLIENIFLVNNIFTTELTYNSSILEYSVDRVTGNKKTNNLNFGSNKNRARASMRNNERRNKTAFGPRGQTETSLKIENLRSNW